MVRSAILVGEFSCVPGRMLKSVLFKGLTLTARGEHSVIC